MNEKKSIDGLSLNSIDPENMFLLFNNKLVILYNTIKDHIERIFNNNDFITVIFLYNNCFNTIEFIKFIKL